MVAETAKWGTGTHKLQTCELNWQKLVDGNCAKIKQFQEAAGALQKFKTYLFVREGSSYFMVIHSPSMKFVAKINKSIYMEQDTSKLIVNLKFNPGKDVAHLFLASKGLPILTCCAQKSTEMERSQEWEHAMAATENPLSKGVM